MNELISLTSGDHYYMRGYNPHRADLLYTVWFIS